MCELPAVSVMPTNDADAARVGLFRTWRDAFDQAAFRADITRRRYRVWLEPNNRWWNNAELTARVGDQ